uniref:Uncharacterized protein n=1 Tax=Pseudo-nitzschia arenysensis TaxID=697910 RepID=A0A7S0F815_9STRA|mmetsp:Transcript_527/g.1220  ORF Transcript_527/g.1220 Transcript_527/m.1220 type:complete len:568 (+) Transcript_527:57-1760(+)
MPKEEIHGLAATIRSATSSETFDLGGLPSTTISQVVNDAFSGDFELDSGEMIRITLVVGAGKGNRAKYDPAALKIVTTSLTASGYVEDRGASCVVESAGCFKFQHDTGKNLKTVVVFPKIAKGKGANPTESMPASSSLLPPNSLEYKIAVSTLSLFTNMLKFKFPSWSQKRALMMLIDEALVEPLDKFDAILMRGGLLSEDENMLYEQCISVSEKKALVKDGMSHQVQDGKLTSSEVNFLLDQVGARMEELKSSKKAIPQSLQERQTKLQSIAKDPMSPLPLKHHAALGKLWKQAAPLVYLKATGGKLLSPAETKKRGQLDDILYEIAELEESSRGLLEDDESYQERIQSYRRDLQQKYGKISSEKGSSKKKAVIGGSSSSSKGKQSAWSSTTKFHTPNHGAKGGAWSAGKKKKNKVGSLNKGDLFGAMMADSDSDSEEDGDESVEKRADVGSQSAAKSLSTNSQPSTESTTGGGGSSKRKKKKKKTKSKTTQYDDDKVLDAAVAANHAPSKKEEDKNELQQSGGNGLVILSFLLSVITEWIIPFVLALLVWLAELLFGKSKKKKKA